MPLTIRRAAATDIRDFSQWRYDVPYDVYDIDLEPQEAGDYFLQEDVRCHVLIERDSLIGYCTFGQDAQVPGGVYSDGLLDIGLGMKPDRTNLGQGHRYAAAVTKYALGHFVADGLRVTIAEGNRRAIKVWAGAGFKEISRFESDREILGSLSWVIFGLASD